MSLYEVGQAPVLTRFSLSSQVAQMILGEDGSVITFQLKLPDSSEIHVVSLVRAAAARTTQQPAPVPPQNNKSAALPPAYSDRNVPQSGAGVPADHNSQLAEPVQTQSQEGSDGRVRDWLASSSGTTQPAEPDREEGGFAGSLATPPLAPKLHQLTPDYEGDVSSAPSRSVLAKSKEFAAHIIQLVEAQDVQLREEVGETVSKLLHTINAAMREFDKERFQIQQDAKTTRDLANKVLELQDAVASLSTPGTTYRDGAQIQYQQYVPPGHQGSPMGSVQENAVYDEGYEDQHRDHVVLREEAVM